MEPGRRTRHRHQRRCAPSTPTSMFLATRSTRPNNSSSKTKTPLPPRPSRCHDRRRWRKPQHHRSLRPPQRTNASTRRQGPPQLHNNAYSLLSEMINGADPASWEEDFLKAWSTTLAPGDAFLQRREASGDFFERGLTAIQQSDTILLVIQHCLTQRLKVNVDQVIRYLYQLNFNEYFKRTRWTSIATIVLQPASGRSVGADGEAGHRRTIKRRCPSVEPFKVVITRRASAFSAILIKP